jgi:hypothetical protein
MLLVFSEILSNNWSFSSHVLIICRKFHQQVHQKIISSSLLSDQPAVSAILGILREREQPAVHGQLRGRCELAANYAVAGGEYGRVLTISSVPWLNSRIAVHAHAKGLPRTLQRKTHMIPFAQVSSDAKITPEMHAVETQ